MTNKEITNTVIAIGFKQDSKNKEVFIKSYDKFKYEITVDLSKDKIDYGNLIKRGDETTSNLQHSENLVVLECVNRLIEKGYKPNDLTLEKKWKLGRTAKSGKADITVKGKDGKTLLIIECKTWGHEFTKELDNMKSNGGQLFSYFQQDKNTRYLCLYASVLNNDKIDKINALLRVEDKTEEKVQQQETEKIITYEHAKTIKEMLEVWKHKTKGKQTFLDKGLFEDEIEPYNPGYIPLKINDLKDFVKEDKGKVFNQFEEILRHNNISDRSNAFNRIISLILAKIVDETKGVDAITDFQVKDGIDDAETLLERLQSLYSKAMKDYLDEDVIDYKLEDIEKQIENFPRQTAKETLYRIYKELKFYQNNEFAFKEVYNKKLFEENAKVLEEVVRLFQKYRFKYDQKAQFLGDFFELMLESGYKQSEGQFFTPTPIARFIISSIPLKSIVQEKLKKGEKLFLPKVIDFACGSGHFLTEAIEEIVDLIKAMDDSEIEDEKSITELKRYKEDMRWAGDYIFGLEKDYRLARTSQVACFMHGDGDANIIFGDGLEKHPRLAKDGTFDVLIANPPYTIKDFKKHLNVNPHDFELWEHVTPDSDDIEVFFIERMKQLLRPGGMAGIILPSSILSNAGAYTKAREIILKHFEIKAIVEFGGNTFGATSTNTVTLFLKRRNEDFVTNCEYIAEDFISDNKEREGDFLNSEELFENYVAQLELEMDDYKTFIARNPNDNIKETEFYKSYKSWFDGLTEVVNFKKRKTFTDLPKADQEAKLKSMFFDLVLEIETEKFFYFLLTHRIEEDPENFGWYDDQTEDGIPLKVAYPQQKAIPQKMLIVKTGSTNKEQEKFLGYKFSNRRGYKGIDFTGDTLMFDRADQLNPKKVNSYIYKNFVDEKMKINEELAESLSLVRLTDCISFETIDFDKRLNLSAESFADPKDYKWPTKAFKYVLQPIIGSQTKIEKTEWKEKGNIPVISQEKEFISGYVSDVEPITDLPVIVFGDHTTIFKYIDFQFVRGADGVKLFKPISDYIPKAFYYICQTLDIPASQKYTRHYKYLSNVKIPVPSKDIQQKIITEIEAIEAKEAKAKKMIEVKRQAITKLFDSIEANQVSLKSITSKIGSGATPRGGESSYKASGISLIRSQNIYDYGMLEDGLAFIDDEQADKLKNVIVEKDDVLFNITGASVCRCCIIEEKYLPARVNQHVAIIRPTNKVLPNYLHQILVSPRIKSQLLTIARGATSREAITKQQLEDFKIPLPSIEDQKKLVKELEKQLKEIQKQEQAIANTEEEKKAVLTKYLEK